MQLIDFYAWCQYIYAVYTCCLSCLCVVCLLCICISGSGRVSHMIDSSIFVAELCLHTNWQVTLNLARITFGKQLSLILVHVLVEFKVSAYIKLH